MLTRLGYEVLVRTGLEVLEVHQRLYEWTDGRIGARLGPLEMLLLRTRGRKTGKPRSASLLFGRDADRLVVVGSRGGSDRPPAWFLNLEADPRAEVQVGRQRWPVRARVAKGKERARLWRLMNRYWNYDGYQARTDREIPVIVLERTG